MVSFSGGIIWCEPSGDYTVATLVEIVLMFVVYHVSKIGGRLDNGPVCGRPNSFMV